MPDADGAELNKTVLHDWHVAAGAKMVDFGGWHMPVQYPSDIIQEHLATRRHAGLFDVSHMGRFRVRGAGAEDFLLAALTNNARALDPGHAQYTFIANQAGGAVDDAYLYRLGAADFLLVVNAANRAKDWQWLEDLKDGDMELVDESDALAMVSKPAPFRRTSATGSAPSPSTATMSLSPAPATPASRSASSCSRGVRSRSVCGRP